MCKTRVDKKYHFDANNQWPKMVPVGLGIYRANNQQEYDNLIKEQNTFTTINAIFSFGLVIVGIVAFVCMVLFI